MAIIGGNDEKEKELIDIEFTEQTVDREMMKMLLTLDDRMYKKITRKILPRPTSLKSKIARWWGKSFKKVTEWLYDCGIVSNEKKI